MERKIGGICRKSAREILEDNKKCIKRLQNVIWEHYLGKESLPVPEGKMNRMKSELSEDLHGPVSEGIHFRLRLM